MILTIVYFVTAAILLLASCAFYFTFDLIAGLAMGAATAVAAVLHWLGALKSPFRVNAGRAPRYSHRLGAYHNSLDKDGA